MTASCAYQVRSYMKIRQHPTRQIRTGSVKNVSPLKKDLNQAEDFPPLGACASSRPCTAETTGGETERKCSYESIDPAQERKSTNPHRASACLPPTFAKSASGRSSAGRRLPRLQHGPR